MASNKERVPLQAQSRVVVVDQDYGSAAQDTTQERRSSTAERFYSRILSPQRAAMYFAEFLGTAFLVMFVKLCSTSGDPTTALAIGLGLAIMINNLGHISGAQFNPSVAIAVLVRNTPAFPRSDKTRIAMYFLMQFLGGIVGGLLAWMIDEDSTGVYPTVYQSAEYYGSTSRLLSAFAGEIVFTFLLTSTVLYTATDARVAGNQYFGLSIGLSLTVAIVCIGRLSGCCLNAAVWLGTVIPAVLDDKVEFDLSDAWVYWVGPAMGGLIAGFLFNLFNKKVADKKQDDYEEV